MKTSTNEKWMRPECSCVASCILHRILHQTESRSGCTRLHLLRFVWVIMTLQQMISFYIMMSDDAAAGDLL